MLRPSSWIGLAVRAVEIVWLVPWIGMIVMFLIALAWIYLFLPGWVFLTGGR